MVQIFDPIMPDIIVAPSLLAADPGRINEEIVNVVDAGAQWLHLDIMDGHFVPPITFGDNVIKAARKAAPSVFLDTHLMVEHPERFIDSFAACGAGSITIHQEATPHPHRYLQKIRSLGLKSGIAINPGTPAESIFDLLDLADIILVMTVNPGWGGQAFIPESLMKIKKIAQQLSSRGLPAQIEVDGGINERTARQCVGEGATILVAGSFIFGASSYKAAMASLL